MSASRLESLAWSAVIVLALVAVVGARTPIIEARAAAAAAAARDTPHAVAAGDIAQAAASLVSADPFRAARHPSPIPYQPELEGGLSLPPRAPPPVLSVSGIIGGPPWSAVVDGIPGREGSIVVHPGDTLGGLRVRSVKRDTVVIIGADTTWRLIVRRAW